MTAPTQKGAVTTVRIDYSGGNNEQTLFLASDLHIDAVTCAREVLLADLQTAGENYKVACLITTSAGRTDERTIWIKVVDR